MSLKSIAAAALASVAVFAPAASSAQSLDIFACYACQNSGNAAIDASLLANPSVPSDGLLFAFVNNTGFAISNAMFSVTSANPVDSFNIGSIAAGATFIMLPGLSNDSGAHATGGLFSSIGSTADTSDGAGGVNDASVFTFSGLAGGSALNSGSIIPGTPSLIRTWRDLGATGQTSFLGLGPNGDGGCTNCYFSRIGSASIADSVAPVPEPETYALLLAGIGFLGWQSRRRRNRA